MTADENTGPFEVPNPLHDHVGEVVSNIFRQNAQWQELVTSVANFRRKLLLDDQLQGIARGLTDTLVPTFKFLDTTAIVRASVDQHLRLVDAWAPAFEVDHLEGVKEVIRSFATHLNIQPTSSLLAATTTQLREDDLLQVEVPLDEDPEVQAVADSFLDVVAQEAPDVAHAIDTSVESIPSAQARQHARRILAWMLYGIILAATAAGVILPFPYNAIAVAMAAAPGAADVLDKVKREEPVTE